MKIMMKLSFFPNGIYSPVYSFVVLQSVRPVKAFVTCTASVSAFAAMYQPMLIVNAARQKCFIANGALIRPGFDEQNLKK